MAEHEDGAWGYAALAFEAMLSGDIERAEHWLGRIPRSFRGRIKIACDDLDMTLSRLGSNG